MTKLIINATSVKAGGAKKRLLEFLSRADRDDRYKIILLKNSAFDVKVSRTHLITLPSSMEPLFRLLSDIFIVPLMYLLGYKKAYIFGNFFISPYPGRMIWNLTNIEPFVHERHEVAYTGRHHRRLAILRSLFWLSRNPDILVAQSESTASLLKNKCDCRIENVYNGIDISGRDLSRDASERVNDKSISLIVICQVIRYKRIDQFLNYLMQKGLFDSVKLQIVGKLTWDTEYVHELRNLIASLHIEDRVTLCGELPHEQTLSMLEKSDALVYTNAYDNCPNVVLEAMSCGVHVLALENEVIKELARKFGGVSFFTFEMGHNEFLELLDSPEPSTYRFTWDDHYSEITRMIDQL